MGGQSLHVSDLRHRFAGQSADFLVVPQLALAPGESLGIAGPSGAGKSTLFHCMAGLTLPRSGSIVWGQAELTRMSVAQRTQWRREHLGLIFQDFHLVAGMTALDNVLLPVSFEAWRVPTVLHNKARDLLSALGLTAHDRRIELMSRGERQRVAFARALLREPAVVMADEPTASLDPVHREQAGDMLVQLCRQSGATLVVISHEASLLQRMDRSLTVRAGQLQTEERGA